MTTHTTFRPNASNGLSLVELLVAMVVGLLLLTGITQVYIYNFVATRTVTGFSDQKTNARVALNSLTNSLRLAGHYGGVRADLIETTGSLSISGVGGCDTDWIINTDNPIVGYEGDDDIDDVGLPTGCIASDSYVAESDIVVVRYAAPSGMAALADLSSGKVYLRTAFSTGQQGGSIMLGSNGGLSRFGNGDGVGTYNYEYKTELYYLRPCSELSGSSCTNGLQTLVRLQITDTALVTQPIADSVEQFQIEYGVDTSDPKDNTADVYQIASAVGSWSDVVSARFSIVVRSDQRTNGQTDSGTYSLAGDYDYTPSTADRKYPRKTYTRVVQLRNLSRSPS